MDKKTIDQFDKADSAMKELLAEKKWNIEKAVVLNRFGTPLIEAFVPDDDYENLKNYKFAEYKGFKVIFSRFRTWNPNYENNHT